jgi:glycosyltransferase involved in cell wall biosynthesis
MNTRVPRVSIGMAIYNEEKYLRKALDSLLAQDFADFELIISDNASVDATQEICREYAARDPRVRYHRNETNVGATENFNRAFRLSSGEYFMWAGGHDIWAPTYLSRCVEVLDSDDAVVLCNSATRHIGQDGEDLGVTVRQIDTRNCSVLRRFNLVLWQVTAVLVYSLIRASALRQTHLYQRVFGPDCLLALELSLLGPFAVVPQLLFFARDNRGERTQLRSRANWKKPFLERLYPGEKNPVGRFPYVRSTFENLLMVKQAQLGYGLKVALMASVIPAYFLKYFARLPLSVRRPLREFVLRQLSGIAGQW